MKETPIRSLPGIPFLLGVLVIGALAAWMLITGANPDSNPGGAVSQIRVVAGLLVGCSNAWYWVKQTGKDE